jgi:hypothetical protein
MLRDCGDVLELTDSITGKDPPRYRYFAEDSGRRLIGVWRHSFTMWCESVAFGDDEVVDALHADDSACVEIASGGDLAWVDD